MPIYFRPLYEKSKPALVGALLRGFGKRYVVLMPPTLGDEPRESPFDARGILGFRSLPAARKLSYFIEPNLTGKAATRPDTYRSFGLRFAMKKRNETDAAFRARVNAAQEKDTSTTEGETDCWLLGPKAVQAGSLHCDLWRGHAIDLAGHDSIAVYPVGGWWKSHVGQRRVTDMGRYALTVSISAPGQAVDIHAEIANLVEVKEAEVLIG